MKFNINHNVKIKLTNRGREILKKDYNGFCLEREDENGWSEWQLWVLIQFFGKYLVMGMEIPFETEIEIPEN